MTDLHPGFEWSLAKKPWVTPKLSELTKTDDPRFRELIERWRRSGNREREACARELEEVLSPCRDCGGHHWPFNGCFQPRATKEATSVVSSPPASEPQV